MTAAALPPVRVRLLQTTKVADVWQLRGAVLEVDQKDGARLIRDGKAVPAGETRPLEDRRLDSAEAWRAAGRDVRADRETEDGE